MPTTVSCRRCKTESTGFDIAPLPSPWGDELRSSTCRNCFKDWMGAEVMIINEYRLDLGIPRNQDLLNQEMARFLNLPSSDGQESAGAPPEATPLDSHGHSHGKGAGGGSCC